MRKAKYSSIAFCFIFFFTFSILAQSNFADLTRSVQEYSEKNPWEKIYLHTDKPHYLLNDTIWIKAYALIESGK